MAKVAERTMAHYHANCGQIKIGGAHSYFRDKRLQGLN